MLDEYIGNELGCLLIGYEFKEGMLEIRVICLLKKYIEYLNRKKK